MAPGERRVGIWNLWRARLAGEAVGDLTFGPVVAEPLRLIALGDKLSLSTGISSLAVENIAYTVSSCLMVMAGALTLLASFGLNESVRKAVLTSLVVVIVVIVLSFIVIGRRWKLVSGVLEIMDRTMLRASVRLDRLRELEDYIFDFYSKRRMDFLLVVLCEILFHFAGVVEIFTTLRLIGVDLNFATAFMLEAINRAINIAFIFVPALVGVDEAGTGLVTNTLGFGATAGVTLAIIRKIRMFFWIGIGLIFLAAARRSE